MIGKGLRYIYPEGTGRRLKNKNGQKEKIPFCPF
jgi:hypothetical protein